MVGRVALGLALLGALSQLCTAPGGAAALVVPAAAAASVPAEAPAAAGRPPATGRADVDGGVLRWTLEATTDPGRRWIRRNEPCATFAPVDGGSAGRVCPLSPRQARVTRPDGTAFRTPVRTRWKERSLIVSVRQADAGLPPGGYVVTPSCGTAACADSSARMTVPVPRVSSCAAAPPWLVHEGAPGIGRAVAVTFDDGPGANTRRVVRILRRESVLATFFQLGRMVEADPAMTTRLVRRGHVVGNHSYSHALLSGGERRELVSTNRAIRAAGAPRPCLFRAPYGENPPALVALARDLGMVTIHWNTDPGDWRGLSADAIVDTTLRQVRPGSILVLHDADPGSAMVRALPVILERLKARGYRFLTVPELLRLDIEYR